MKPKTLILGLVVMIACQPASPPVDLAEAESAVRSLFENYGNSTKGKDAEAIEAMLADDGLFLGTDPGEYWSKETIMAEFRKMIADTTFNFDFTLEKRDIRVNPDGKAALVVEQAMIPFLSRRISIRSIGHARMTEGKWLIDFYSWQLIPVNKDLYQLDAALARMAQ